MFTGIIEEIGYVKAIQSGTHSAILRIKAGSILSDIHIGDSIAINGICLTVTHFTKSYLEADVMHETLRRTAFRSLKSGSAVNLERAMRMNGRFGGHIVTGHIDGTARITKIERDGNAIWYTFKTEESLLRYIVEKGSVSIDGISLTVAAVTDHSVLVSVIPHTAENTILSQKKIGDIVNVETDIIGKYIFKLQGMKRETTSYGDITKELLIRHGF